MTATDRLFGGSALRYLAVLAAAALTFTLLPLAGSATGQEEAVPECDPAPFTDREEIPEAHRNNVDCAFAEGIVQGFTDNTYRPALSVRRDQMGTFIHGVLDAAGVDVPEGESDTFDDVPDGNVHSDAVNGLAAADIVRGGPGTLPPNMYGPALSTRRDQMTSFMMRAAEFALGTSFGSTNQQFPDVPSSNVHFQNVNAAAEHNLALGRTDGLFYPSDEVRRDQMSSFMIRLLYFIRSEMEPTTPEPTPEPPEELLVNLTDAPELRITRFQREFPDTVRFEFEFDQTVSPDGLDPRRFFLNLWDGSRIQGISAVRDDRGVDDGFTEMRDDRVRVVFPKVQPRHGDDSTPIPDLPGITGQDMTYPGHYPTHGGAAASATSAPGVLSSAAAYSALAAGARAPFPMTWEARTAASVAHRAVRSAADDLLVNPEAGYPLMAQTLEAGRSQFPNLIGVENFIFQSEAQHPQGRGNTVEFIFDRPISDAEIAQAMGNGNVDTDVGFGLILRGQPLQGAFTGPGGQAATGQARGAYVLRGYMIERVGGLNSAGENRIRVYFESGFLNPAHASGNAFLTADVQAETARAYVDQGVFDATAWNFHDGTESGETWYNGHGPVTTVEVNHGGMTARPDITNVELLDVDSGAAPRPAGDRVVFTFSAPVYNPYSPVGAAPGSADFRIWHQNAVEQFHAYHYNGKRETAIWAERHLQNSNQVRVTFPPGTIMSSVGPDQPNKSVVGYGINGWTDHTDSSDDPHHQNCRQATGAGQAGPTVVWVGPSPTGQPCTHSAAVRDSGNETLNEPHIFRVSQSFIRGETLAPNLLRVHINPTASDPATGVITEYTVAYVFDRAVDDWAAWHDRFTLYDENGVRRTADCDGGGCTYGPSGARNEVRILASDAGGGYSLIAGRDAVLGGTVWNTVHNRPVHVQEAIGFVVGGGDDQRTSSGYTWCEVSIAIGRADGPFHGDDPADVDRCTGNFIINYESSRPVEERVDS